MGKNAQRHKQDVKQKIMQEQDNRIFYTVCKKSDFDLPNHSYPIQRNGEGEWWREGQKYAGSWTPPDYRLIAPE